MFIRAHGPAFLCCLSLLLLVSACANKDDDGDTAGTDPTDLGPSEPTDSKPATEIDTEDGASPLSLDCQFEQQLPPATAADWMLGFAAIDGNSRTDAIAVGHESRGSEVRGVVYERDSQGWQRRKLGVLPVLTAVFRASPDEVFLGGGDFTEGPSILRYDGATATAMTTPPSAANGVLALYGTGKDNVFASVGEDIWRFDGSAWSVSLSRPGAAFSSLFGCGETEIYAMNTNGDGGEDGQPTALFRFDGATWEDLAPPQAADQNKVAYWTGVCIEPGQVLLAGSLFARLDNGQWQEQGALDDLLGHPFSAVMSLVVSPDGEVWASSGSRGDVLRFASDGGLEVLTTPVMSISGLLALGTSELIAVGGTGGIGELTAGVVSSYAHPATSSVIDLLSLPDASCAVIRDDGAIYRGTSGSFSALSASGGFTATAATAAGESDVLVAAVTTSSTFATRRLEPHLYPIEPMDTVEVPTLQRISSAGPEPLWTGGPLLDDMCASAGRAYYVTADGELWVTAGSAPPKLVESPSGRRPRLACAADGVYAISRGALALGPIEYLVERLDGDHWSELGRFELDDSIDDMAAVEGVVYAASVRGRIVRIDASGSAVVHTVSEEHGCASGGLLTIASSTDIYALTCEKLSHYDGSTWSVLVPSVRDSGCAVTALDVTPSGALIAACGGSVARLDSATWTTLATLSDDQIATALDAHGSEGILLGTHSGDVLRIADGALVEVAAGMAGPVLWMQRAGDITWFAGLRGSVARLTGDAAQVVVSSPACDHIVSLLATSADTALALCSNGDLMDVSTSGVSSRSGSLPWQIGVVPEGTWGRLRWSRLTGSADNLFALGGVWPIVGKDETFGLLYHFDGAAWRRLADLGANVPTFAFGQDPDDVTIVVEDWAAAYHDNIEVLRYDGAFWQTVAILASACEGDYIEALSSPLGDGDLFVDVQGALNRFDGASWRTITTSIGSARYTGPSASNLCAASTDGAVWTGGCTF